jgi:hypothetical protein
LTDFKKKPIIDHRKIRGSENYSFRQIKEFYRSEIEPIIKMLPDTQLTESFKQSLKKYLIISLISSLEHFFRSEAKHVVDKNDKDITSLFSGQMSFSVSQLDKMLKDRILTKGNIVASSYNFANLDDMNNVFSKLLNLDFLDYVHKLNDIDQTRYPKKFLKLCSMLFNTFRILKMPLKNTIVI